VAKLKQNDLDKLKQDKMKQPAKVG